jgi:DNA repair protein RAD57
LIWTTQIACRIALIKSPVYAEGKTDKGQQGELILKRWRRWVKVVFAPWTRPSGMAFEGAVEFLITGAGIRAVVSEELEA